eukprot:1246649-Pleurochrysis_carterae.AAC.2
MRWPGEVVVGEGHGFFASQEAGRLSQVRVRWLSERGHGIRVRSPWEGKLVEIHTQGGDDFVRRGYPNVVGARRQPA